MNEDVNGIIAELMELYDDGKIVIAKFQHVYETIVPSRFNDPTPKLAYDNYGMPYFTTRNPMDTPEHHQLADVVKKVDDYAQKWVKSVNDLLGKVEQTRYKLQFNDPNQKGFFASNFGETTPTEDHLLEVVNDLTMRHAELRQIILEIERNNETIKQPIKDVEPATYDKKKKAILFAGAVIGFKKNADTAPFLCNKIFGNPNKLWTLKELQEEWDIECKKADWRRVYETISRINRRVQKATGVNDLFIINSKKVRLNPAYLMTQ